MLTNPEVGKQMPLLVGGFSNETCHAFLDRRGTAAANDDRRSPRDEKTMHSVETLIELTYICRLQEVGMCQRQSVSGQKADG